MSRTLLAAIFDWAGTIIDHGCQAPTATFMELFSSLGISVTSEEIRGPMGLEKRDHLRTVLKAPRVADQWIRRHGQRPGEADVDQLFKQFLPIQSRVLPRHTDVIPGAVDAIAQCRLRGLKIGSCTGYSAEVIGWLLPAAEKGGLSVDAVVSPDNVGGGRPLPWMIFENMRRLGIYPPHAVVKIDDTPVGMEEATNAGVWRVGVTLTGNGVGLSADELDRLSIEERRSRADAVGIELVRAGAHFVIDAVVDLPPVIDQINQRLGRGEVP